MSLISAAIYFLCAAISGASVFALSKTKATRRFCLAVLCCAVLSEIFLFNFDSFHLFFSDYPEKTLELESASASGFYEDGGAYYPTKKDASLEFSAVGQPVGTVYIGISSGESEKVKLSIDASDETNSAPRRSVAKLNIYTADDSTKLVVLRLSGNTETIRLNFTFDSGTSASVNSITLNRPVPFSFSAVRLLFIFLFAVAVYTLIKFPYSRKSFSENRRLCRFFAVIMTGVLIASALALSIAYSYQDDRTLLGDFSSYEGNQISKELVDSFEAGQVSLLETPPDELLALDNPYDYSQRKQADIDYSWDHCLYEGRYYSYYGIAPVVTLFLPYHLITGFYFPTVAAVFIYGALAVMFLSLLFYEIVKRFFSGISTGMFIASLVILQLSSCIWFCFCTPLFYEIAQTSGDMFVLAGFYFLISSSVIGDGKISKPRLSVATSLLSLAVLCRPTLALYCVSSLIFIWFGLIKQRAVSKSVKGTLCYIASALIPFIVFGTAQMLYNYLRFDSPFEFGIKYSLTINDFIHSQYHTRFALIGFYNYLFAPPSFDPTVFPYLHSSFSYLSANGYYFTANKISIGLVFRALPTLAYLMSLRALKTLEPKKRLMPALLMGVTCIAAPVAIIFSIWESGYGIRYAADFSWQMITGALCILFFLYAKSKNDEKRRMCEYFIILSAAAALLVNASMIYSYFPASI